MGAAMDDEKSSQWKTVARGVQVKFHPDRKHGKAPDRYFRIRYAVDGKMVSESLGWASEGMTQEDAVSIRLQYIKAKKGIIDAPTTKAEAKQLEAQAKAEAERQQQLEAARNVTLSEYWPVYLTSAKLISGDRKKAKSWQSDESAFSNWLQPILGDVPIKDIDVDHWDRFMGAMVDGQLAPRTRQYMAGVLRQVLAFAYSRKLVPFPPPAARDVGATIGKGGNRRTRTLSTAELQAILQALAERDRAAHAITIFCAMTGCRLGEAAGLEWKDLDLSVGEATFRATKNGKDRTIPLPVPLVAFLVDLRSQGRVAGHVFLNSAGNPYTQTPQPFRDTVEALGLNEGRGKRDRVVFHTLRHSAATRLAKGGMSLPDLQALCGWSSPIMALRYAHDDDKTKRKAMDALADELAMPSKVTSIFGK
ncbi:MAG: site-specific integrase [Deltaproteobacteria bacterium]|nr:site-specific integrase [Deltaproteobacteria bacterium]